MDLFRKRHRYSATVVKFQGKLQKVKQSQDSDTKRMIVMDLEVPVTKKILKLLDHRIQHVLPNDGGELNHELDLNSIDLVCECVAIVSLFGTSDYSKTSQPKVALGRDNDDQATLKLKKIVVRDGEPFLKIALTCRFRRELWNWGGDLFDGGEIVVESAPFQPELDFEESPKAAVKKEPEKAKAKTKAKAAKPSKPTGSRKRPVSILNATANKPNKK